MEVFLTFLSLVISDYQCQLDLIVDIPYINLLVNEIKSSWNKLREAEGNPTSLKQKQTSKFFAHEVNNAPFFLCMQMNEKELKSKTIAFYNNILFKEWYKIWAIIIDSTYNKGFFLLLI